jgi:ABC-type glycerol-3-phosphate transport system permease component
VSAEATSATAVRPHAQAVARRRKGGRPTRWALSLVALAVALIYLFPLLWTLSSSVRTTDDVFSDSVLPNSFRLQNYPDAWDQFALGQPYLNTVLITLGTVVISVLLSVTAAYGFARYRGRLSNVLFLLVLMGLTVPPIAIIVPFFLTMRELHLYNSLLAVVLGETAFMLPLAILLLRGYMDQIPSQLVDAARVDGATEWRAFWSIVFPLLRAPLASVTFLIIISTWNGFLLPLVLLADPADSTVTVGLSTLSTQFGQQNLELLCAAAVMVVLPVMVFFIAARRYYVQGLTSGAVKQ